jgi:hypothetical protein
LLPPVLMLRADCSLFALKKSGLGHFRWKTSTGTKTRFWGEGWEFGANVGNRWFVPRQGRS